MDQLMNKLSVYHMLDSIVPGFVLTFEFYNILPIALRNMFNGHKWIVLIIFIFLSFIIGMINNHVSGYLVQIYEESNIEKNGKGSITNLKKGISRLIRKLMNYRRKKLAMKMESEFHVSVEDITIEEVEEEPNSIIDVKIEEENELYNYIKENYLPDIIKECSEQEIYEYIYLDLQKTTVQNRLSDYLTQKGLNRNLSSFCVISAIVSIFLSFECNILLSILYKLFMICIFLLVGLVFYKEYEKITKKFKKYMLMWYIQEHEQ